MDRENHSEKHPLRVVIAGGVAAGPKVASKIIRLCPEAEVTIVEEGKFLSYAGCGLPYYVSGAVKEQKELMSTPVGVVRDPVFFQHVKNVKVLSETEALEIDRAGKCLHVRQHNTVGGSYLGFPSPIAGGPFVRRKGIRGQKEAER